MNEIYINTSILPCVDMISYHETDHVFVKHKSADYNIMLYVTGGSLNIEEAGIRYNLNEGDIYFLKSGTNHTVTSTGRGKITYYRVNFFMNTEYKESNQTKPILTTAKTDKEEITGADVRTTVNQLYMVPKHVENAIGSILDKKVHDYYDYFTSENRSFDLEINTSFYDILAECVKLSGEYRQPQTSLSDEIIDYLNEHSNQQLNTTDMEKRFFLTYKYMGTAFKKDTGFTILSYHTNLRMHTARKLLTTTSYSIDEISRILGYTDALYFSRVFKKNNSISPQDYRKRHRNADN